MTIEDKLVHAEVEFKKFRIPMPHVQDAMLQLRVARRVGRQTVGKQQKIVPIVGPSHSGKSTIIDMYREDVNLNEPLPLDWHPVLHVTLTSKANMASLGSDIIHELGALAPPPEVIADALARGARRRFHDSDDPKGTIPQILHLAVRAMANAGIEMLVIDELQHLIQSETQKTMWSVADAIKWLSIKGVCAITCVGITSIMNVISATSNRSQFTNRCREPIMLNPIDITDKLQRETFLGYLMATDNLMVSSGIFSQSSDLVQEDWVDCFYDVSRGILGRASRLVEVATVNAIRNERPCLTIKDFSRATERWAMALALTDHDPWLNGPRDYAEILRIAKKEI